MIILSLDLGTKCGYAVTNMDNGDTIDLIDSGTIDCSFDKAGGELAGTRFIKFREFLRSMKNKYNIDAVYYEEVTFFSFAYATKAYGAFEAITQMACIQWGYPLHGVAVPTLKKHTTGKGNAKKDMMIAKIKELGHSPKDDNEADAIALAYYAFDVDYKE